MKDCLKSANKVSFEGDREVNIEFESKNGFIIASPKEDIDKANSEELDQTLMEQINRGNFNFILDFGAVGYIDSSGIGAIVRINRTLKEKSGSIILAACNENIVKIFKLISFHKFFKIVASVEQALTEKSK